ncbi:hypothetical protein ACEZCY_16010 [Streptacidiphilus sp. N1-12]|uniref:Uncharacterized protein n=2 Tax=Streptacidiphilus alkalitolerans TaxID=3342712 RepID=A0ABV6WYE9_9ACTN
MNAPHDISHWMIHLLWKDTARQLTVVLLSAVGFASLVQSQRSRRPGRG